MGTKELQNTRYANINYDVYNALNLLNENLGECYLTEGFNPFNKGFELSEEFVLNRYKNNCIKNDLISPEFIEQGEISTKKAFEKSVQNIDAVILKLDQLLMDYTLREKTKKEYERLRLYFVCRRQLTMIFIERIGKDKNTLKMYDELTRLDLEIDEYCNDIFSEFFNAEVAIHAFMQFVKESKLSEQDKKLIQKAKDIIKKNQEEIKESTIKQQSRTHTLEKIKAPVFKSMEQKQEILKSAEGSKRQTAQTAEEIAQKTVFGKKVEIKPQQGSDELLRKYQEFIKERDINQSTTSETINDEKPKEKTPLQRGEVSTERNTEDVER